MINYRTRFRKKKKRTRLTTITKAGDGSVNQSPVNPLFTHRHWQFLLKKENVEHNAAMKALVAAGGGGVHANDVGTAGMKDRVAITVCMACGARTTTFCLKLPVF